MDDIEVEAKKMIEEGDETIKNFLTGFGKILKEKEIENKKFVVEAYKNMNLVTLLYNALLIKNELESRYKKGDA